MADQVGSASSAVVATEQIAEEKKMLLELEKELAERKAALKRKQRQLSNERATEEIRAQKEKKFKGTTHAEATVPPTLVVSKKRKDPEQPAPAAASKFKLPSIEELAPKRTVTAAAASTAVAAAHDIAPFSVFLQQVIDLNVPFAPVVVELAATVRSDGHTKLVTTTRPAKQSQMSMMEALKVLPDGMAKKLRAGKGAAGSAPKMRFTYSGDQKNSFLGLLAFYGGNVTTLIRELRRAKHKNAPFLFDCLIASSFF